MFTLTKKVIVDGVITKYDWYRRKDNPCEFYNLRVKVD